MRELWNKFLCALLQPWQKLPLGFHYAFGAVLSRMMRLVSYRRDIVSVNLSRSFPEARYGEIKKIYRDFYRHLGECAAEALWIGGRHGARGARKVRRSGLVGIEGQEEIFDAFRKGSVMVLNSHCGNWELMGASLQLTVDSEGSEMTAHDVAVVYRRLHGKFSEYFFRRNRCSLQPKDFDGCVESRVVMRYVLRHRHEKKLYVFPNDQYPYGTAIARTEVKFMNQSTLAMTGAAEVAAKFGMSVFYMNSDRERKGRYTVRFSKICDNAAEAGTGKIISEYYRLLEKDIRKNPSNYLWSHKRWK